MRWGKGIGKDKWENDKYKRQAKKILDTYNFFFSWKKIRKIQVDKNRIQGKKMWKQEKP